MLFLLLAGHLDHKNYINSETCCVINYYSALNPALKPVKKEIMRQGERVGKTDPITSCSLSCWSHSSRLATWAIFPTAVPFSPFSCLSSACSSLGCWNIKINYFPLLERPSYGKVGGIKQFQVLTFVFSAGLQSLRSSCWALSETPTLGFWYFSCSFARSEKNRDYIYAFSRRFYPKLWNSGYTFFISMCVTWELNPQPFALLMQCSNTEPQTHRRCLRLASV